MRQNLPKGFFLFYFFMAFYDWIKYSSLEREGGRERERVVETRKFWSRRRKWWKCMEMATPRLGAVFESYAALSRKILKINLDFFPSFSPKISAAVVSRRCVRDRKRVELFNFEKWTGKAGKAREREKKKVISIHFCLFFYLFLHSKKVCCGHWKTFRSSRRKKEAKRETFPKG